MARHQSAVKAARQAVRRTVRNQAGISKMKTVIKKIRAAIAEKGDKKTLASLLSEAQRTLMKAASKNLIKRETASRQVSRLSLAISKMATAPAAKSTSKSKSATT